MRDGGGAPHDARGGEKTALRSQFSALLLPWALGTELGSSGLFGKSFCLLSPLTSPLPYLLRLSLSLELTDLPRLLGH